MHETANQCVLYNLHSYEVSTQVAQSIDFAGFGRPPRSSLGGQVVPQERAFRS